jgi:hypothetical protein
MIHLLEMVGCLLALIVGIPAAAYFAWLVLMYQMGRK